MKRWLRFLFVSLYALSGCAPATAPLPPLATPIPDSPQEYHVGPLRWQEDTVVTYAMQEAQEGRRGNAVTTEAAQHVVEFRAVERTTLGQFWVRCALDGAEVADVLVERDGDTVVVHLKSPAHPLAWKALLPLMRHAERLAKTPKRLRRGEPVRVTLPGSFVLPFVPKWAWPGFAKELEMEWVFTVRGMCAWARPSRPPSRRGAPTSSRARSVARQTAGGPRCVWPTSAWRTRSTVIRRARTSWWDTTSPPRRAPWRGHP